MPFEPTLAQVRLKPWPKVPHFRCKDGMGTTRAAMMHRAAKRRRLRDQKEPDVEKEVEEEVEVKEVEEDSSHISLEQFQFIFNIVSETWNDFSTEEAHAVFNKTWEKLSPTHDHQLQSEDKRTNEESRRKRRRKRKGKRRRREQKRTYDVKPEASAAVGEPVAEAAAWPKPTQLQTNNLAKQSGVPNINWNRTSVAWQVKFPRIGPKGEKIGMTTRSFAVKKFMVPGRSEAEADAAALQAAKAFLAELAQKGIISEKAAAEKAQQKLAQCEVGGANRQFCIKPEDSEELERTAPSKRPWPGQRTRRRRRKWLRRPRSSL
eukprot:Skav200612  [mRNA]  locus=scaffold2873:8727:9797:- [translate_table: standard]